MTVHRRCSTGSEFSAAALLAGKRPDRLLGAPGEIFPNVAFLPRQPRTIAVWHPRGAHQTEVWRWFLVDREAPREVKDFLRDYYIRYSGPGG